MVNYYMLLVGSFFYAEKILYLHKIQTDELMEVSEMRVRITMACAECKQRNYDTSKNKKNDPDRIENKKYCKFCRKHTEHKETK